MQPKINLYAVSAGTSFLEGLGKFLKKENEICLAGCYRGFDSALKRFKNDNTSLPNNKIIFIDDISLDKIQTLNFLKNFQPGFRLDEIKTIVYTNSIDSGYLRGLWSSNVNAILHEKETRIKDLFVTEKFRKSAVSIYTKISRPLVSVQTSTKLIETIKAVNNGINCYDSIVRNFMSRRDKWAIDNTKAKSIIKNQDALKFNETSAALRGRDARHVQDLAIKHVNAEESEKVIEPNRKTKRIKALFISAQSILIAGLISICCDDPLISLDTKKIPFLNENKKSEAINYDVIIYDDDSLILEEDEKSIQSANEGMNNLLGSKFKRRRIVFTDKQEISNLKRIISHGVDGIVSKHSDPDKLKEAIAKVADGEKYFDKKIYQIIQADSKNMSVLTEIEVRVYSYLQVNLGYKEIAAKLFLSPHTVRRHMEDMMKKLGVKSISELKAIIIHPRNIS